MQTKPIIEPIDYLQWSNKKIDTLVYLNYITLHGAIKPPSEKETKDENAST